jgi:hypothetical protein
VLAIEDGTDRRKQSQTTKRRVLQREALYKDVHEELDSVVELPPRPKKLKTNPVESKCLLVA